MICLNSRLPSHRLVKVPPSTMEIRSLLTIEVLLQMAQSSTQVTTEVSPCLSQLGNDRPYHAGIKAS